MNATSSLPRTDIPVFDCEQTVRRLWDYLDGQLGPVELAAVDAHLADCDRCPPHFEFERRFLNAVRAARAVASAPEPAKAQALRERVVSMLRTEGELRTPGAFR